MQTARRRRVGVVKQHRVDDLLDRDSPDLIGREKGKRGGRDRRWDGPCDIHGRDPFFEAALGSDGLDYSEQRA